LNGRYETTTDVTDYLNIGLDASKMSESDNYEVTLDIYKNGAQRDTPNSITLQSLSLTAEDEMNDNPFYHMFRYAFWDLGYNREGEGDGSFDGSPVESYADTVVQDLFALHLPAIESDAALVMNVWMASVNGIFEAMAKCREHDSDSAIAALDKAAALWVGANQEEGSNEKGHLLYNLAENAGERFDQDGGETEVNTQVMNGFVELQMALQGGSCDDKSASTIRYAALRSTVYWLTGIMAVPLVQNLIHHTVNIENEGGSNMVELYALGIIPRVATCDPKAYEYLLKLDVLNDLRVEDEDKAIEAIQSVYSCLGLTCQDVGSYMGGEVPACVDETNETAFTQGGYKATSNGARSLSRIDRDILQIDAFLKYGANNLATDWYTNGWNSELSLQTLAKHNFIPDLPDPESSYYSLYSDFYEKSEIYQSADVIHEKIQNILNGADSTFQEASPGQRRSAITGFLQYVIMFVNTADSLKYATSQCFNGSLESAKEFVDASAMFFVGSMANTNINSSGFADGKSIFVMAQELCNDFGTCIQTGENAGAAVASELIIMSMNRIVENIDASNCDEVQSLVESTILPALSVPVVQGLLKQAKYNEDLVAGSDDAGLATGDLLSRAILPLVNKASPDSANVIMVQMEYQPNAQPVVDGFESVASAFRGGTLTDMGIECSLVGVLSVEPTMGAMCGDGVTPSGGPITQTKLGFGRYIFSNPTLASAHAAFALDVRDMFNAETISDGRLIYKDGANAQTTNVYGEDIDLEPWTPSLGSLSIMAALVMHDDPMFNIYKYALYDDRDFEDFSGETFAFANDIIVEALDKGEDTKLAAEATVVLQIFLAITNKLYSAVRTCDEKISPESEIDSAVALWIGDLQGEGKFDDGFMMYSIAQSVEKFFGYPEGESPVNSILMNLFVQAQTTARTCTVEPASFMTLRSLSHEIIRLLSQSIIKSLLFHIVNSTKNMVELYAVAAIPQCAACDPQAQKVLKGAFFQGYNKDTSITDEVLDAFGIFLQCQRITCENIKPGRDADEDLKNLVDKLCDRLGEDTNTNLPVAGYVPEYPVNEEARLDLDALEIDIMMRTQAYGAAEYIYKFGHNSGASNGATLFSFSEVQDQNENIIMQAITERGDYASATRGESAEIVRRALQSMVSHHAVLSKMRASVESCDNGSLATAKQEWDTAVALFVGSIEGILAGSKSHRHGVLMYALMNEFCGEFGTCETNGEATVNEQIMFHFASGRDSMADGECDDLKDLVSKSITPKLLIPHIQGIISSSIKIIDNLASNPELLATVHILSQTVIPAVQSLNAGAASLLSSSFGSFSTVSTNPALFDIINVFTNFLDDYGIPCDAIGNPSGYNLCTTSAGDAGSTFEDTPTNLADNLYVTTTHVEDRADIALDIKDISEALEEGNNEIAQLIYRKGKNSKKYDENGKFVRTRSLQAFSRISTNDMIEEPQFNMFMYTLGNQMYADDLVEEALANSKPSNSDVATEAAMVLNLWMEIVHLMHETLQGCKNKQLRDDDGIFLMDAAVAYWIGDGQVAGDGENGHLLYALSERFGQTFNIDNAGQSRTNTNILRLFNEAKNEVSLPNACSESQYTYTKLRGIVNRLIPQMAIPLIQGLILSLRENDRERVKIYSHAYIPLVAGCSPSLYQSLMEKFFSSNEYNVIEVESIIDMIRQSYDCLGLKCDDIGVHEAGKTMTVPECKDPEIDAYLAGYRPASDVRQYSRFDLDIREMDVLLQMEAYSAVDELYTYGKHVRGANGASISIGQLATTKHRNIVPEFDRFVQYYSTDTFADDIIRAAIDSAKLEWEDNWTAEQRRIVIIKATQVLVMYFAALQNAYEAVEDCKLTKRRNLQNPQSSKPSDSWDQVAAILIGSLEGTEKNGTVEGYMFYDLAQQHCMEFGTCLDDTTGVSLNEELVSLLYAGRAEYQRSACRALEKVADELSNLLLIPVIQGALSTSSVLSTGQDLERRAEAYVYGRALVPFVRKRDAANDIDLYLGNPGPSDKRHTEQKIYAALATAYPNMDVDCKVIGIRNGIDTCAGVVYVSDYIWIVVGVGVGMLFLCYGAFVFFRRRRKSVQPENNPSFVSPKGEMNHSMDLLERAFSRRQQNLTPDSSHSDSDDSDIEMEALNRKYINEREDQMTDTFSDEDDGQSDVYNEAVALTSKGDDII